MRNPLASELAPTRASRTLLLSACLTGLWLLPSLAFGWQEEAVATERVLPATAEVTTDPQLAALVELGRDGHSVRNTIEVITRYFPRRLTGSSTLKLAVDWARVALEEYGLESSIESWGQVEVGFDRGQSRGRVVAPVERSLTFVTPCWSPGTLGAVRGPVMLEPQNVEELKEREAEFAGAWLLRNPKVGRRDRAAFDKALTEVGVAGSLSPGSRDGRLVTSGSWKVTWDALPTLVKITLLFDEFEQLSKEVAAAQEAGEERLQLEFEIENQFLHGPIPQYNVIADIRGSEWPDEYVIVQAHIDAWDGAQGACDNGTGVATTMEAARLIRNAGIQPKRTIRFVLYTGEEQGLYGSNGYVERHVAELDKISLVLNHDNGTRYLKGIGATPAMLEDFRAVFAPIQRLDPARPFEVREVRGLGPGPSDHSPFIMAGVPGFHWDQSHEGYRRLHHTQYDTLEEVVDEDQAHSALVVAMAAVGFANLDHLVDRTFMREPQPRLMGVNLSRESPCEIERVTPDSRAASAGWQVGDRVVSVDDVEVKTNDDLTKAIQAAGPKMMIAILRGEERIASEFDYTDDPLEEERSAWRAHEQEVKAAAQAQESAPKGQEPPAHGNDGL